MSRKINVIIIIACIALIIATALIYGGTNTEPFWSDFLLSIILKHPCAAIVAVTEAVHLKLRSWKTELAGLAISAFILLGTGAMTLLMTLRATLEVRKELYVTLAINVAVTAALYIKMRKGKVNENGIT